MPNKFADNTFLNSFLRRKIERHAFKSADNAKVLFCHFISTPVPFPYIHYLPFTLAFRKTIISVQIEVMTCDHGLVRYYLTRWIVYCLFVCFYCACGCVCVFFYCSTTI